MVRHVRVLAIHGIAHQEARKPQWQPGWEFAITGGIREWAPDVAVSVKFFDYDDLFASAPLNPLTMAKAMAELFGGLAIHGTADLFRQRGLSEWTEAQRWGAGMVAQWSADAGLRARLRSRLLKAVADFSPDAICAHSLGSLLAYDALVWPNEKSDLADTTFISFGSQIGFPAVRGIYGGFIRPIVCRMWYHLYNPRDDVFTAPIRLRDEHFKEVITEFELPGPGDHDGASYLGHPAARENVWREVATQFSRALRHRTKRRTVARARRLRGPTRRAFLVGINEYRNAGDRLAGCINDAFQMSAALQECGFAASDICLTADARATADGIRRGLEWLLDDADDGDQRVFYYAGHGSQIARSGFGESVDRLDECLVPSDFDGSAETTITDDDLFDLYAQLPYGTNFVAIFDCCHSGGLARPSGQRVRTISPPDDIRHRSLRWDPNREMWLTRDLAPANRDLLKYPGLVTSVGARRIGSGVAARRLGDPDYDRVRKRLGHRGPHWPLLLFACGESEMASEYNHGSITYGAFTFSLVKLLRERCRSGLRTTFSGIVRDTERLLHSPELGFDQTPQIHGPAEKLGATIPWLGGRRGIKASPARG